MLPIGVRVATVREVDRYPDFLVPAGATGTIIARSERESFVAVKLDQRLVGTKRKIIIVWWRGEVFADFVHDVKLCAPRRELDY